MGGVERAQRAERLAEPDPAAVGDHHALAAPLGEGRGRLLAPGFQLGASAGRDADGRDQQAEDEERLPRAGTVEDVIGVIQHRSKHGDRGWPDTPASNGIALAPRIGVVSTLSDSRVHRSEYPVSLTTVNLSVWVPSTTHGVVDRFDQVGSDRGFLALPARGEDRPDAPRQVRAAPAP